MSRSLFSMGLMATLLHAGAQSYVHQVVVLNEGYYDYFGGGGQVVPVTLGSYDPASGAYQTVATFQGPRFGSDVLVDGGSIYVAADDRIYRLDADGFAILSEVPVQGVRKLAVWNDLLLVSRGELGGLPHYFEARDRTDLGLVTTLGPSEGLLYSAEDVLVLGDKAYLAVNNAFDWDNLQGRIGIVDLTTMTYAGEVDLGPDGLNPEKLMEHEGDVFAFNNKDLTGSSISRVAVADASLTYTVNVSVNSGCAASAKVSGNNAIYFLEYAQNELARFDLQAGSVVDTLEGSPAVYGLIEDPVNNVLYATTTDFQSTGELHVMSMGGSMLSTVQVGVAPGNLALDIRSTTGLREGTGGTVVPYPVPAIDAITLAGVLPAGPWVMEVLDAMGRIVMQRSVPAGGAPMLSVATLKPGAYFLRLNGRDPVRFMKQ